MGEIEIRGIECPARIGVTEEERSRPQRLLVDLTLRLDLGRASVSGRLEDTSDYHSLVEMVRSHAASGSFNLVETLADQLCGLVLEDGRIEKVRVRVRKYPRSLEGLVRDVAIRLVRRR